MNLRPKNDEKRIRSLSLFASALASASLIVLLASLLLRCIRSVTRLIAPTRHTSSAALRPSGPTNIIGRALRFLRKGGVDGGGGGAGIGSNGVAVTAAVMASTADSRRTDDWRRRLRDVEGFLLLPCRFLLAPSVAKIDGCVVFLVVSSTVGLRWLCDKHTPDPGRAKALQWSTAQTRLFRPLPSARTKLFIVFFILLDLR